MYHVIDKYEETTGKIQPELLLELLSTNEIFRIGSA